MDSREIVAQSTGAENQPSADDDGGETKEEGKEEKEEIENGVEAEESSGFPESTDSSADYSDKTMNNMDDDETESMLVEKTKPEVSIRFDLLKPSIDFFLYSFLYFFFIYDCLGFDEQYNARSRLSIPAKDERSW